MVILGCAMLAALLCAAPDTLEANPAAPAAAPEPPAASAGRAPQLSTSRPAPEPPEEGSPLTGRLKLEPRGIFVVNAGYNGRTLVPGSFAFYAVPPSLAKSQSYISPANTTLGFKLSGLSFKGAELTGALDVTLRSPTPLITANTISPQFYAVYIQLEGDHLRVVVGQFPDVLLPFVPDTANSFPSGYVPGAIGFARPQLRGDLRLPFGERSQALIKVSLNQPVQTFELTNEAVGRQGGVPDVQARVSVALGRSRYPWERPFELGLGGHVGRRRITALPSGETASYQTWSLVGDLRAKTPWGMQLKARLWRGSLLGDYMGGIFQTVDLGTMRAVRAVGCWVEVQQALTEHWKATLGYGRDDPFDVDLSANGRALNQAGFANVFWNVSKTIGFAAEVSAWKTSYLAVGATELWRGDIVFLLRF